MTRKLFVFCAHLKNGKHVTRIWYTYTHKYKYAFDNVSNPAPKRSKESKRSPILTNYTHAILKTVRLFPLSQEQQTRSDLIFKISPPQKVYPFAGPFVRFSQARRVNRAGEKAGKFFARKLNCERPQREEEEEEQGVQRVPVLWLGPLSLIGSERTIRYSSENG